MRVIGIDLGTRRIGIAVSDAGGSLASPLTVLQRSGDPVRDRQAIARVVAEEEAERVVVGMPLSLSGAAGPAAEAAQTEVEELTAVLPVPVETWDERLTTVAAHRALEAGGRRSRQRRQVVDQVAAALMLQSWLDSGRGR
jgi:putative Holliday junction resolvase